MDNKDKQFQYRIIGNMKKRQACFNWCVDNLAIGSWKTLISPIFDDSETYVFINEEDLMAFKLIWG